MQFYRTKWGEGKVSMAYGSLGHEEGDKVPGWEVKALAVKS